MRNYHYEWVLAPLTLIFNMDNCYCDFLSYFYACDDVHYTECHFLVC